jgi:hypothetical protein
VVKREVVATHAGDLLLAQTPKLLDGEVAIRAVGHRASKLMRNLEIET